MKFEKITDDKIKVVLSLEDIQLNNISSENLFNNSSSSQKLLQVMLNKAEKEIGFIPGDSKLLVEVIMPSEQECIFTITKFLENNSNPFIFKFACFDDYIALCTFLNNLSDLNLREFSKNFSLIFYNNTYYLYNLDIENYSILLDYMREIFSEFAISVSNSAGIDGILNEYGKVIFENDAIVNGIFHFV